MGKELLSLPFAIQIALGAGYLGYLLAYSGIRQHHTTTDAFFRSVAFGLAASAIIYFGQPVWWNVALAATAPLAIAIFWRWRGMRWAKSLLRHCDVNWADDIPTAWISIVAEDTQTRPSQIAIDLEDGRTLLCEDTRPFADAPHGPCKFGLDGSIALYVTAEMRPDGSWIEKQDVRNPMHGDLITYVPASSIKRVEIRCWTRANGRAATEGAEALSQVVESAATPA
jgi:hypothetical protein